MNRFKNILVVVSGDGDLRNNPAVARGVELAQQNQARLTLMDVISPPEQAILEYKGIIKPNELTAMLVSQRERQLQGIAEGLDEDIPVSVTIKTGRDFIEIIRQVILEKHDLLIKVANDHPSSFDSSDFNLMRKCPQPVWLFKPKAHSTTQKILAAIDLSMENDEEGRALNSLIMDLATSLAKQQDSELHIISCWSLYGENTMRYSGFIKIGEDQLAEMLEQEAQANRVRQEAFAAKYQELEIYTHLVKGEPTDVIPKFTRDQDINVLVMGTVARTGIPGLLIGNTAETILRLIDTSVITAKPQGFESPIK